MSPAEKHQLILDFIQKEEPYIHFLVGKICWKLFRRKASQHEREEIFQEFVCFFLGKTSAFRPGDGAESTWLHWQHRAFISHQKINKRQNVCHLATDAMCESQWETMIPSNELDPLEQVGRDDLKQIVGKCIEKLPPVQAWALDGMLIKGKNSSALAQERGVVQRVVWNRMKEGKEKLSRSKVLKRLAKSMGVV